MYSCVRWNHISSGIFRAESYIFGFWCFLERFKESISRFPANFEKISESRKFLTYHVTRPLIGLKLAFSKTYSDSFNMGRVCSVLMPVVTLQSFKVIGCLKVGLMWNSKIKNWRKMANLTNEKGEFAIAIFRHFSPFFAIFRCFFAIFRRLSPVRNSMLWFASRTRFKCNKN